MASDRNRIHHVVGFVRHENFHAAIARLSMALQTSFYGPFDRPDLGLRLAISWDAGIELISPLSNDPAAPGYEAYAAMKEGWISVVVAMRDLPSACKRLEDIGHAIVSRYSILDRPLPFADRFERLDEVSFAAEAFAGLPLVLADVQEKA